MIYRGWTIKREFPSGLYTAHPEIEDTTGNYFTNLRADTIEGLKSLMDSTKGLISYE